MSQPKHLSAEEFDVFMQKRRAEQLKDVPEGVRGFILGCYFDIEYKDNILTKCAKCDIPLYVRPYIHKIAAERNWPILCLECSPRAIVKGALIQDLAAIVQHTGEK